MAAPLLRTKLYIPPVRPALVSRPRLIERLNQGIDRKLTLVSAPAGFGKTTLLSQWVAGCDRSCAWISLDQGDNDPAHFLAYLVAALQTIDADIIDSVPSAFQSSEAPAVESILTALINEVAFTSEPIILVLDDYHLITTPRVHDAVAFLLDHLPANMHLVIATRADPPLPIALLRGRGQVTELRQADLRFTPAEVAEFLNQVMGLELTADDIDAIASRTEGWIAGLQMAVVSMQGQDNITTFVQAFTGSNRFILDYLMEEVLQRQPPSIQTFLLQTAILDRLTASLCDAVLEIGPFDQAQDRDQRLETDDQAQSLISNLRSPGQQILEQLEATNLFIVPLDDERKWYRYHRLFADLLRQRLRQAYPDLVPALHRRASKWYADNGSMTEAIEHALWAEDFERAADLIEETAETTLMRSEVATFFSWVERLPDGLICSRPDLCVYHAWAMLLSGRSIDEAERRLQNMQGDAELVQAKAAPLRALIAIYQGQLKHGWELASLALERLPADDLLLRSIAAMALGMAHFMNGDTPAGTQALDEAARMGQEIGNVMISVSALSDLAGLSMRQGQLNQAETVYQQALELATDKAGRRLPIAGEALIGLGELARERNQLEDAARYLAEGIEFTQQWSKVAAMAGYMSLARVRQAQGEVAGASDAIREARRLAVKFDVTEIDDLYVDVLQARLWLIQGNRDPVARWAEQRRLKQDIGVSQLDWSDDFVNYHVRKYEIVAYTRLLLALGQADQALVLLQPLLAMMEDRGRIGLVIEILMLRALAFQAQGRTSLALAALERVLSLAEPAGYVRLFIDEGEPMGELLRQAIRRGITVGYARRLLDALEDELSEEQGGPACASLPLAEPLSERELEVLRLLTTSLTSTEIADELYIAASTVRSHVKNIYGKLNVHSRIEAIQRAEELEML